MSLNALSTLHGAARCALCCVACLAACSGGEHEAAHPALLIGATTAQGRPAASAAESKVTKGPAPTPAAVASPGGQAALDSYRPDADPGHAAIANYDP
jgi:hypothetical protein